ncbi:pseudouridine synthase-like protein TruD/Pus7 [Bimuria novae-zelandiae CBS 107.79]|uniref:Pseudouridine synthase-like protein TruD/Pus7 n=1 Tax=Bimuria novae-zelandiae CBS 107.79 TaxID=1447943 RepID=A0A6A5VXM4_9PLEO|nr:pseudouridine synthase-like protein TruD/Pus7 [Bimuria novae-zelandiae CBS 107.79]
MSEPSDIDSRPAKRARLEEPAVPAAAAADLTSSTAPTAADALPKAPIPADRPANDSSVERESRAGITEYVHPDNLGFSGVLKQRYTDFLVNEIGLDGEVLHLRRASIEGKNDAGRRRNEAVVAEEKAKGNKERKVEAVTESGPVAKVKHEESVVDETTTASGTGARKEDGSPPVTKAANGTPKDTTDGHEVVQLQKEEEVEVADADLATLHEIFGEPTTKEIVALVRAIRRKEDRKAKDFRPVIAPPITDKDVRTRAHQSLRRIFPNLLESSMEADQSLRIKAVPPKERKGKNKRDRNDRTNGRDAGPDRRKGQLAWEELGGEFLHFTLYKENKDTMEVIGFLGSKLGGGKNPFSFAGTKDRRACTVQRVCVKRQTAERMNQLNKVLYNAAIGDYSYENRDLGLGDLMGNEFVITLRDCHFQSEEGLDLEQRLKLANDIVSKAITDFSKEGFINYYGLQRFGSFAASTDTVGLKMLQNNLKGAVEDLLAYSGTALAAAEGTLEDPSVLISQDDKNRAKALHIWKTKGKGGTALDCLPHKFKAERSIIQHLSSRNSKNGRYDRTNDWQGALMLIPRQLRLMYVHAYQSLVWNTVAGKRWNTYGANVVEGDLVLVHEHKDKEANAESTIKDYIDQDGEVVINPAGEDSALAADDQFERARALTAEEAASGQYSIFDVVLPQPGFDVEYPKNEIGRFYEEFMGSERGGGLDPHDMRRSWREISLSGGYRKILARPLKPLEYEVHSYVRNEEQFVETDLQRLRKEEGAQKEEQNGAQEDVEMSDEAGRKIAVVLKLQLGSSQYATMALRELMKAGGVKAYKPEFMGGR